MGRTDLPDRTEHGASMGGTWRDDDSVFTIAQGGATIASNSRQIVSDAWRLAPDLVPREVWSVSITEREVVAGLGGDACDFQMFPTFLRRGRASQEPPSAGKG